MTHCPVKPAGTSKTMPLLIPISNVYVPTAVFAGIENKSVEDETATPLEFPYGIVPVADGWS